MENDKLRYNCEGVTDVNLPYVGEETQVTTLPHHLTMTASNTVLFSMDTTTIKRKCVYHKVCRDEDSNICNSCKHSNVRMISYFEHMEGRNDIKEQ